MNYILFDSNSRESFFPIVSLRPIASIRIGALTIKEKWDFFLNTDCSYLVPDYLSEKFPSCLEDDNVFIDSSVLPNFNVVQQILGLKIGEGLFLNNEMIACRTSQFDSELKKKEVVFNVTKINHTWDIVSVLKNELGSDFVRIKSMYSEIGSHEYATLINTDNILVGKDVKIGACILNATEGEIIIDDEAEVMDGAIIKGPIYIGKHSVVKMGAKLYGPIAVGEQCRIGGEVCDSVLQGYCNKGHDGFLGHSYIGEWCNIGADSNTSNLKNNYDKVRLWNYSSQCFDKTGLQFLGLIMGDHSKTGINTMINTGTVIGIASNVYGAGFPRNFVPDFTEGSALKLKESRLTSVYKMASSMMARRDIEFTHIDQAIVQYLFSISQKFRRF